MTPCRPHVLLLCTALTLGLAACAGGAQGGAGSSTAPTTTAPSSAEPSDTTTSTAGDAGPSDLPPTTSGDDRPPEAGRTTAPDAAEPLEAGGVRWEVVTDSLAVPREVVALDGDVLLVTDQAGLVVVIEKGAQRQEPFLDLRDVVTAPSSRALEVGLAGFAPAPDFAESGTFYTMTTERPSDDDGPGFVATTQVLTRWQADLETLTVDPSSAAVLMRVARPRHDHIAGEIVFDDQGRLYTSFGAKERSDEAQDPSTFDGTVVRIDPATSEGDRPYGIPADNPFAAEGGLPEVYSYGYRNPWRLSWTSEHGLLVGEAMFRHKDQQVSQPAPGDDAGYPEVRRSCYDEDGRRDAGCERTEAGVLISPSVLEYGPDIGLILSSVAPVPDGVAEPLAGRVLVSDWRGTLLVATPGEAPWTWEEHPVPESLLGPGDLLWDISPDGAGGLYASITGSQMSDGVLYRLVAAEN